MPPALHKISGLSPLSIRIYRSQLLPVVRLYAWRAKIMQRNAVSSGDHIMVITHVYRTLVTTLHAALLYPTRASEMCDGKGWSKN